jgi:5-carboxymethyl-2-hydroxymuconate isomerase
MPHLILEHSREVTLKTDMKQLVQELHSEFAQQETVKLSAVKTRTVVADNAIVGDGSKKEFVFLKVLLLSGRSNELKEKFVQVLNSILNKHVNTEKCFLCIEICELQYYYTDK